MSSTSSFRSERGLVVRPPAPSDLRAVVELGQAFEQAMIGETEFTESDVREDWERFDVGRDAWVVLADGRIGGYATWEDRGGGRFVADGYVHPELRGRGIGTTLVDLTEARAGEEAEQAPAGERIHIHNATLRADEDGLRLFERRGYRPVRHFFRMVIDMELPPPRPDSLGEIVLEPFHPERDALAVHEALEEAFVQEFAHRPHSFEEFRERLLDSDRFDPGLWFVARDRGEIAGAIVCTWKRFDVGWINSVGVRLGWRGRGVGMALLRAAFGEFHRRGERRCALGVDANNTTGATHLYERVGMRVLWEAVIFEKELVPA